MSLHPTLSAVIADSAPTEKLRTRYAAAASRLAEADQPHSDPNPGSHVHLNVNGRARPASIKQVASSPFGPCDTRQLRSGGYAVVFGRNSPAI
jgi:hypothetical protein